MKRILLAALMLMVPVLASAQTPLRNPGEVYFTPSDDHAILDSYVVGVFTSTTSMTSILEFNIGKPAPAADTFCHSIIYNEVIKPLTWKADYIVRVKSVGKDANGNLVSGDWSDPSNPFDRAPGKPPKVGAK